MTVRTVSKMGDQKLLQPSAMVTHIQLDDVDQLLIDMKDTMLALGGVGISAPQIGVNLRVMMFGFDHSERYPDAEPVPFTILINPSFTPLSQMTEVLYEGCLSIPGIRAPVRRFTSIQYKGQTPKGDIIERQVTGFHARVFQHEFDHLEGILFTSRVEDMRMMAFEDELKRLR